MTITEQEQEKHQQQITWIQSFINSYERLAGTTVKLEIQTVFSAMDEAGLWFTKTDPGYTSTN